MRDLRDRLQIPKRARNTLETMRQNEFRMALESLADAGLIAIREDMIEITPLMAKVQAALGFSLTKLAQLDEFTLSVKPLFGKPRDQHTETQRLIHKAVKPFLFLGEPMEQTSTFEIFVLMPFAPEFKPVYDRHLSTVAKSLGVSIGRADDSFSSEMIMECVWNGIWSSRLVIADCTTQNPNVLYEIGIAHTVGKPVILISQDTEHLPYDLRHLRCLVYGISIEERKWFEKTLAKTIQQLLGNRSQAALE
jgi:hypothetical protein